MAQDLDGAVEFSTAVVALRPNIFWVLIILGGSGYLSLLILVSGKTIGIEYAAILPILLVALGLIVLYPFVGLFTVVIFTQLDAIANLISEDIPISITKALVFFTFAGIVLLSYREPRSERFGPDEIGMRCVFLFAAALVVTGLPTLLKGEIFLWFTLGALEKLGGQMLLFYVTLRLVKTETQIDRLLFAILASTLFSSVIAIGDAVVGENLLSSSEAAVSAQTEEGEARTSGASDLDPTATATMLLAGVSLAMILMVRTTRWLWLTVPTFLTGTFACMLTFARSAAVVYVVAIVWLFLKFRRDRRFPGVVVMSIIIGISAVPFAPPDYWDRVASVTEIHDDISLRRRLAYNLVGVELLIDNPVLGVGPGNFRAHFIEEEFRYYSGRTLTPRELHNMYLSVAVETGMLGFLPFFAMLLIAVLAVSKVWKYGKTEEIRIKAEALQFCLVTYLIACVFVPNQYIKYTWFLSAFAIAYGRLHGWPGRRLLRFNQRPEIRGRESTASDFKPS